MARKEGHNLETLVERYALPGIAAVILYRAFDVRLPSVEDLFITPEEQVSDALGDLNLQEKEAGRMPFALTRSVLPYNRPLENPTSFYNDDDDYFDGYLADDNSVLGELGENNSARRQPARRAAPVRRQPARRAPTPTPTPKPAPARRTLSLPPSTKLSGGLQQIGVPGELSFTTLDPSTYAAVTGSGEPPPPPPPRSLAVVNAQRQPGHSPRYGLFDSINTAVSSLFGKRSNSTPQDGAPQSNEPSANDGGSFGGIGTTEILLIAAVALFALKGKG